MTTVIDSRATLLEIRPDGEIVEIGVPGHADVCFVCWEYASACRCYADYVRSLSSEAQQVA